MEVTNAFSLRFGTRQGCLLLLLHFNPVQEELANLILQENNIENMNNIEKTDVKNWKTG